MKFLWHWFGINTIAKLIQFNKISKILLHTIIITVVGSFLMLF